MHRIKTFFHKPDGGQVLETSFAAQSPVFLTEGSVQTRLK